MQTLIIGYGNEWRSDDGIGPTVARQLESLSLPNVRALAVHQLTPELAEIVSHFERVFFVDACRQNQPTPVVIEPITNLDATWRDAHVSDPRAILTLSHLLYDRKPCCWMVSVEGERFEPGDSLSNAASRHVQKAVQQISDMLGQV